MSFRVREIRATAFGTLALVDLPDANDFPIPLGLEEALYAAALPAPRRATWVGGRVALHAGLEALGAPYAGAILATERGAPAMPAGFLGSVSHKPTLAVALVAREDPAARVTIGIDVEIPRPLRYGIAPRVLTPPEQAEVAALPVEKRDREVLRRFAAKEAIYKALDPWVRRFVSFQEVATERSADGQLMATLQLHDPNGPFGVQLIEADDASEIMTAARVGPIAGV